MNETILEMRNITKCFPGVTVLKDVNFSLKKGEVHALIGENGAGKSTLMNILLGIHQPDSGEIVFKGNVVHFHSPHDALNSGISMIHQEISLIPTMTVAENVWMGREKHFATHGLINKDLQIKRTKEFMDDLGLHIDPSVIVSTLSVAKMQLVEIVRAVSYDSDVIIMDEPTSALSGEEIQLLYSIIRKLKAKGVTVVFISHKLQELFDICDRMTALRDGCFVASCDMANVTTDQLIRYIAGREVSNLYPKSEAKIGDVILEVKNLSRVGTFNNISFSLRKGEILGFSGLMGAGRTEIMRAIFGIDKLDSGKIYIKGKEVTIKSPKDAIKNGIGMVTEDRLRLGVFHMLPVRTNISIVNLYKYVKNFLINKTAEKNDVQQMIENLSIKVSNMEQPIASLSGGNQQKALFGRWLMYNPEILILDEPTRGIDVGSKSEIHKLVSLLAQSGLAVLMISSELPEVTGISDRVLIMHEGEIVAEHLRGDFDQEKMMREAFGVNNN